MLFLQDLTWSGAYQMIRQSMTSGLPRMHDVAVFIPPLHHVISPSVIGIVWIKLISHVIRNPHPYKQTRWFHICDMPCSTFLKTFWHQNPSSDSNKFVRDGLYQNITSHLYERHDAYDILDDLVDQDRFWTTR